MNTDDNDEPRYVLANWEASCEAAAAFQRGTRVTAKTEPGLVGEVTDPPTHLYGGLGDLAKVWIVWPDGGSSGHAPGDVALAEPAANDPQGGPETDEWF